VKFEVLTAVMMTIKVLWNVMLSFGEMLHTFQLTVLPSWVGSNSPRHLTIINQNTRNYWHNDTQSHPEHFNLYKNVCDYYNQGRRCVFCSISCMGKKAKLSQRHAESKEAKLRYSLFTPYFVTKCQRHFTYAQL